MLSQAKVDAEWQPLNYHTRPDFGVAVAEHKRLVEIIQGVGAEVVYLPAQESLTMDSLYVRDAATVCARGVILCNMGKPARAGEPGVHGEHFRKAGIPIAGAITGEGKVEGGDIIWLDQRHVGIARGYRTNAEGIRQFREIVGPDVHVEVAVLPHYKGQSDVFHLMSIISPVDRDLAVVYSPLLPVPFRERLLHSGVDLVEVPDAEFDTMGTNVLALAPRRCLMLAGNPQTRRALERAGADVLEYEGHEISIKGAGGPTCLTRPLERLPL
jgi:N-dimethylarginine dimethylaminohydrolase